MKAPRRSHASEPAEIVRLYQERSVAVPVVEEAIRTLLESDAGPFGRTVHFTTIVDEWAARNPERVLLTHARLRSLGHIAVHRLLPGAVTGLEAFYTRDVFPAMACEFLDGLSGPSHVVRQAIDAWIEKNPDGHLGSAKQRGEAAYKVWKQRLDLERSEAESLVARFRNL